MCKKIPQDLTSSAGAHKIRPLQLLLCAPAKENDFQKACYLAHATGATTTALSDVCTCEGNHITGRAGVTTEVLGERTGRLGVATQVPAA
jgi:hypothetical protein